jgi:expansin (peptidoglycan-binding protein)
MKKSHSSTILSLALATLGCNTDDDASSTEAADESTSSDDASDGPDDAGDCPDTELFTGDATYYELGDNPVNCSYPIDSLPPYYAALNGPQYGAADLCGACILAEGPNGSIELLIVDQCPGCAMGDIDLSPAAFEQIAALEDGRVDVSWRVVPCSDAPPSIGYRFKEGSSQWWTAIQVVGHRTPLASLEYQRDGAWIDVPRLDYNYFVADPGMGPGPFVLRVTDVFGNTMQNSNIELIPDESIVPGAGNFPGCN